MSCFSERCSLPPHAGNSRTWPPWARSVTFSTAFLEAGGVGKKDGSDAPDTGIGEETGEIATYRVNGLLPVIVWDSGRAQDREHALGLSRPSDVQSSRNCV